MTNARIGPLGIGAAVAWIAVPTLWATATVLDRTRPWEETPQQFFMLGWAALMAGGVLMLLLVMRHTPESHRRRLVVAGYVAYGLGIATTVAIAWAIQVWMFLFGAGLLLFAAALPRIRRTAALIGGGMLGGLALQIILTLATVGRPDSYGDYPVAWTTATIVATAVAAVGVLALDRRSKAAEHDLAVSVR